jgi:hypothetical protein
MAANPDNRSTPELFSDMLSQFAKLVRNEIQLARAEIGVKAKQVMVGSGLLVAAMLFVIPTLVLVLMAFASLLMEMGLRASAAHLLAGATGLLIALILGWTGISRLKADNLIPNRTLNQLQRDAAAAKEHI